MKIGIIGCGVMGSAIARSYDGELLCYDRDATKAESLGAEAAESGEALVANADVVLIAIKPQDFRELDLNFGDKLVISIMAGVSLEDLSSRAVRVMPNLGANVGKSVNAWVAGDGVSDEDKGFVQGFLSAFGVEVELETDDDIDKMTALTGSGPAYLYAFMQALTEAGREFGFNDKVLEKVLPMLVEGSMRAATGDFEEMINKVASKGGTTEAALGVLGEDWRDKLKEAVKAAYERSKEL